MVEEVWQSKLDALETQHQQEKEQLMTEHRHNLATALQEARNTHWNSQVRSGGGMLSSLSKTYKGEIRA
jgi:hypothetical protein